MGARSASSIRRRHASNRAAICLALRSTQKGAVNLLKKCRPVAGTANAQKPVDGFRVTSVNHTKRRNGSRADCGERSAQQMPLERDVLPDRSEARQECLRALRVTKATHTPLGFASGLVAVLSPVVQPGCRFDEHVLHDYQLRNLGLRRRVAAQLIGDDLARHRTRAQHALEEAFWRRPCHAAFAARCRVAMFVDCTP